MVHYTVETQKTPKEMIQLLGENLRKHNFGILWQVNIKDKIRAKDIEVIGDYHVLEVCNPLEAHELLAKNTLAGYYLPCKIVVYEDEGITKIGMPKLTSLLGLIEDESVLEKARELEKKFITIIDQTI